MPMIIIHEILVFANFDKFFKNMHSPIFRCAPHHTIGITVDYYLSVSQPIVDLYFIYTMTHLSNQNTPKGFLFHGYHFLLTYFSIFGKFTCLLLFNPYTIT